MRPISPIPALLALAILPAGCGTGGEEPGPPGAPGETEASAAGNEGSAVESRPLPPLSRTLSEHFALIREGRTGPARVRIRKHLNLNPTDGAAKFLFGLSYHEEKKYAEAVPYFEEALADAPDYYLTHYFMGWARYNLGELDAARAAFEKHLTFDPVAADSHFGLGLVALDEDRLDDAERRFRRAIELHGETPGTEQDRSKARARLADVLIARGDHDAARVELVQSTMLYPDHYEAWLKLSRVLARLGDEEAADNARRMGEAARERVTGAG